MFYCLNNDVNNCMIITHTLDTVKFYTGKETNQWRHSVNSEI